MRMLGFGYGALAGHYFAQGLHPYGVVSLAAALLFLAMWHFKTAPQN